jgi:hypothetical protein
MSRMSGVTSASVCCVPCSCATCGRSPARRTTGPRSPGRRSGPRPGVSRLMSATMMLESMPPDRNAPSGTSAMSRRRTDRRAARAAAVGGLVGDPAAPARPAWRPVSLRPRPRAGAVGGKEQSSPAGSLPTPAHDGARCRHVLPRDEVVHRLEVPLQRDPGRGDYGLQLRAEHHAPGPIPNVQRLDAQPVPGEEQLANGGHPRPPGRTCR